MKRVTIDRTTTYIFFAFILYFLFTGLQIATELSMIVGLLLFGFLCILLLSRITKEKLNYKLYFIIIPFILFQGMYVLNYSSYTKPATLGNITYQAFFVLLMFILASITWKQQNIKILTRISLIIYPFVMFYIFTETESINPNRLGGYSFLLSFFPLLYLIGYSKKYIKPKYLFLITLVISLIWISGTRSVLMALFFILITYFVWKFIIKSKLLFKLYFVFISLFCYAFTVVYPNLDTLLPNYRQLEYMMIEYTGKSILSGRDEIWKLLTDIIMLKPWFGYGAGAQPDDLIFSELSAHNLYLQISLQVGIIGLILFAVFLYFIWKTFWNNRFDKKVMFSASFFIGILIYQLNEVSLTQNNLSFSILQWTIIGVGLSYSLNNTQNKTAI